MRNLPALPLLLALAACGAPAPPDGPPVAGDPPPVASEGFLTARAEADIPMSPPRLRAFMEARPLIGFLEPTENIANPVEAGVLEGTWGEPGAVRWLRLADGHYVIERILENESTLFRYQVFVFTDATGRGVEQIVGEQRFVSTAQGTRVEWTYDVRPRNLLARKVLSGRMEEIDAYITGGLERLAAAARGEAGG